MAKQLNVDMRFTADTSKAKQAITDLEQSLQKLGHSTMPKNAGIDPAQFEKASAAARELEFHLKNAFNEKTGNLDLSKLQNSLQQSHTSLKNLTSGFSQAGAVGQQAFVNLARAIASADQPSLTLNTHLATMWTTLKNVARFQISSSIMHGLIGGIQSAYGYAQDLNESLNNIRIVTGQSTEQMARFAEQANKGARALSATTLDYTDAALIYYQQGLSNEEVVERTETTLKLANVSRQSAEEVSDQMTAIWNNFVDGSHNLEYYADVITALGAATASSSQEIAGGLEKFASVAQTVGLSYEYATSALATIVATTRQSEDTVGTGLRTLFARFEGLSLGKTLEDGVDLNKYSKALQSIGVSVLDTNGNLKNMDEILDQMGEKWDTLSKAQQVALAQTVGGVRQYTNLVALMDNWDFFKENLEVASGAEGSLQEQADIYAESWEAARDRVRAAAESIFQALLDDKFFIGITNTIEHILVGVRSFIDAFGGLKGLMVPLLGFVFQMVSNKISPAIQKIVQDIQILSGGAGKVYRKVQQETNQMVDAEMSRKTTTGADLYSQKDQASLQGSKAILAAKTQLSMVEDRLSASEKMRVQIAISGIETQVAAYEQLGAKIDDVTAKIIKQAEEERKKAKEGIEKKDSMTEEFKENTQGEREERVRQTKREAWNKITGPESSLIEQGFDKETIGVWLQQSENQVNEFGNNLHNALIQAFSDGATDISFIMQTAFEDFNIQDYVTFMDKDMGQTQLQMLYDQMQDLVAVSPEVAAAFEEALDPDVTNFEDSTKKVQQALMDFIANYDELGGKAEQVMKVMGINPAQIASFKKVQKEAQKLQEELEKLEDIAPDINVKDLAKQMLEAKKKGEPLADIFKRFNIPENLQDQFSDLINAMDDAETAGESLQKSADNIDFSHLMSKSEFFTSAASGFMQIASSIQACYAIWNAWNNEDLTIGEKITQTLASVGMIVPSIVGAYTQLTTVWNTAKSAMQGMTLATALNSAISKKKSAADIAQIAISKGLITAKNAEETAALKTALAEEIENLAKENGGKITIKTIINAIKNTVAKTSEAGAHGVNAGAIMAESIAQNTLNASMLIGLAVVLAVIAGVALLAAGIYFLVKAYNKDAEAAKKAAEVSKELDEAAEEANQRLKDIKESIEGYNSAIDVLNSCTKGTQEWNDALANVHEQINEILTKYPELLEEANLFNADGTLNTDVLTAFEQRAENAANAANAAALQGRVTAAQAQLRSDTTDARRRFGYNEYTDTYSSGYTSGKYTNVEKDLQKVMDNYKMVGSAGLELADIYETLGQDVTPAYAQALMDLAESTISATNMANNAARSTINEWARDNDIELEAGQDYLMSEAYQEAYQTYSDAIKTASDTNAKSDNKDHSTLGSAFNGTRFEGRSVTEAFNIARGTNYGLARNGVRGTDDNRTYVYLEGGQEAEYTLEEMQATIAAAAALDQMGIAADEAAEKLANMSDEAKSFLASGNMENLTEDQIRNLRKELTGDENGEVTAEQARDYLISQGLSEAQAEELSQDLALSLNIDFDDLHNQLTKPVQDILNDGANDIDLTQFTIAVQQKLMGALNEAYSHLGKVGTEALEEILNNAITEGIDPEKIINAIDAIDWSAPDAMGQLAAQFESMGVDINLNDPAWQLFIARMQEAERTANSLLGRFDALRQKMADIADITGDIEFGTVIKDEDYQKLIAMNAAVADLFTMTADGWKFVGDVDELNSLLNTSTNDIKEFKQEFEQANAAGEVLSNSAIDFASGTYKSNGQKVADSAKAGVLQGMARYHEDTFNEVRETAGVSEDEWNAINQSMEDARDVNGTLDYEAWAENNAQYAEEVQALMAAAGELQQGYENGIFNSQRAEELWVNTRVKSVDELDALRQSGDITEDTYNRVLKSVIQTESEVQGLDWDEVVDYADYLRNDLLKSMELTEEQALDLAAKQKLLDRGFKTLTESSGDFYQLLDDEQKGTTEYRTALKKMQDGMMDLIGATGSKNLKGTMFDNEFFEENRETIEKATKGDIEAIEALQTAAAHQVATHLIDPEAIDDDGIQILNKVDTLIDQMQEAIPDDIEIGTSIGEIEGMDGYLDSLNQMLASGELTAEQVNAILESIGFDPEIEYEKIPISEEQAETIRAGQSVEVDGRVISASAVHELHTGEELYVTIPKINAKSTTSTSTPKSAGGGGGGSGGGGGNNKQKEKKDPTDERDRYHTITQKIQDATDAYDELSKAEDRAFGKERIKAMEGITNNLKLQIELQKQYLDEIRNYLEGDRAAVEALGATFDANGVITNYDDLIAELVAKYNEGVDAFNNGGLDEDAFKEQYEEPFNDAKEAIDQYVETINLLQSEELNLIDLQNDLADQFREIAAYKLELHIDIDEDELKYLDFLLEMLGENAEDAVDRLDLLGQQFNTNRDEIAAYTTAIQDLLRLRGFTDEDVAAFIRGELTAGDLEERGFTTDDIDKLREYRDAIQDNTTAMNDLAKEIEESFLNTLDDLNEKVDDAEERFEHFAAMLEHFHNVVDIVGQDALGMSAETMKLLAKAAKENAIEMVKAAKTQLDSLNAVRAQAQAQLDAALEAQKNASTAEEKLRADEAVRYWSDTISEVTNRVEQAEEDLADALENALEGIQEMYTTMIEQATKEFERSVTGAAGSLEQLQKNFDRQKETQDLYIPTYEKIYELTKLTRDINNSIDDTDNLWSKQELAKLQDEINQKMEDGVELTEHDVEELRKRYELKVAEAALEEAQDAKRTVRMSRDNEGNWSYVYTADENDVAEAEQNYEDKLYEYQQMNYQYIQDLQANIIQAQQDMADAINDLDAASFASQEEYLAEVQRIRDAAMAKISQYRDQLAQTLDQQGILYEEDWKRYNELTGYRMARDDQWVDNWNETILAQETGFETLEDMFDQITGAIGGPDEPGTYVGDITDAYAEMQASNERALNAAGTSMQTYEQDTIDAISGIDQQMEETQNQVDEFTNSMTEAMEGVSDFIGEWKNQYGEAVKSITEFNKDLYDSCNTLIKKLQDAYGVNADFEAAQAEAAAEALAGNNRGNSSESGNSNGGNNPGQEPGNNHTYTDKIDTTWSSDDSGHWKVKRYYEDGREYKSEPLTKNSHVFKKHNGTIMCKICGYYYIDPDALFKSGGYTGTWSAASARTGMYTGSWNGPDLEENGRLAFLHQKELVLNASDTENFLSAVDMVRQISQTIDLQAASRSNGWNFLLPGILGREPDTLDQNVHIEAHFPNVTSHSEIEEAFTNLVGKASQFANR